MPEQLNVLLADDDADDRYFFNKALNKISASSHLTTVEDGEQLMNYLTKNSGRLPDILFLDLNMPRRNGMECLAKIKTSKALKDLPVIIYSTSLYDEMAAVLYDNGAHYYIKKEGLAEMETTLKIILTLIKDKKFVRPSRDQFIFNPDDLI
jgi:CheY-like chemotaxis protein